MRKLLAGIAPFIVALLLTVGVNSHARAEYPFAVPATHEVGTVTGMIAWCSTIEYMDALVEQTLIPQNNERYLEIMTQEDGFDCYDLRYYNGSPIEVSYVKHMRTITSVHGRLIEIWQVVDGAGTFGYTWTSHAGQGA
jgi:hypothetical protein